MPIIDDLNLSPKTRVVIWEINESFQDLESKVVLGEYSLKLLNQKKCGLGSLNLWKITPRGKRDLVKMDDKKA